VARTTEDPRRHFVGVRLTDAEHQVLALLAKQRGDRYLSEALRSLIPRLRLIPAKDAPAEVVASAQEAERSVRYRRARGRKARKE
jgi:hypothetical protein